MGAGPEVCRYGLADGDLLRVTPEPDVNGIRIVLAFGIDSFSACGYVVENVGVDLAAMLPDRPGHLEGLVTETGIELTPRTACDACEGCPCVLAMPWLVVRDESFVELTPTPEIGTYSVGPAAPFECASEDAHACGADRFALHAETYIIDVGSWDSAPILSGVADAFEGETRSVGRGGLGLRVMRANAACDVEPWDVGAAWVLFGQLVAEDDATESTTGG
jgi:hypothetical protein